MGNDCVLQLFADNADRHAGANSKGGGTTAIHRIGHTLYIGEADALTPSRTQTQ
jgi:hypothetical protein